MAFTFEDLRELAEGGSITVADWNRARQNFQALVAGDEQVGDAGTLDGAALSVSPDSNSDTEIWPSKRVRDHVTTEVSGIVTDMAPPEVRQTVLMGAVDSSGYAAFLSEETTDNISILGATTNVIMSIANGITNYNYTEDADTAPANWSGLTGIGIWFLYADYETVTETVTYNKTRVRPQYGQKFDITKNVLMHFDGDNASTDMIDEYGNVWTAMGDAQLSTGDKKFGTASLELDGTGDYIKNETITSLGDRFCIEFWFHLDNVGINYQTLISASNASGVGLMAVHNYEGSGKIGFFISTNGSSWNIASNYTGSKNTWSNDTWYHLRLEWDGATFKSYIGDGSGASVLDYSLALTSPINAISKIYLSADPSGSYHMDGGIDEFRMDIGYTRDEEAFTPAAAAYSPDAVWFDINTMKMYEGAPGAWTEKIRLFLGEAIMAGNHVSSVVTYALKGYYDSGAFAVEQNILYVKNHNIGCDPEMSAYSRRHDGWNWQLTDMAVSTSLYGPSKSINRKQLLIKATTYLDSLNQVEVKASEAGAVTTSGYYYRVTARRSF